MSESRCDGCDNCLNPRETFDGTIHAQKFLSCVHRVYAKHGFGFGLNHIVEILTGGETEAIRQRGHDQLSTFGIGRDLSRPVWQAIGRELVQRGFIATAPGKFATLQVSEDGMTALRERTNITLTKPFEAVVAKRSKRRTGELARDEILFEKLRATRRRLADERNVPAYLIFSDASLREMARILPTNEAAFSEVPGVGERKLNDFAAAFLATVTAHLKTGNG